MVARDHGLTTGGIASSRRGRLNVVIRPAGPATRAKGRERDRFPPLHLRLRRAFYAPDRIPGASFRASRPPERAIRSPRA